MPIFSAIFKDTVPIAYYPKDGLYLQKCFELLKSVVFIKEIRNTFDCDEGFIHLLKRDSNAFFCITKQMDLIRSDNYLDQVNYVYSNNPDQIEEFLVDAFEKILKPDNNNETLNNSENNSENKKDLSPGNVIDEDSNEIESLEPYAIELLGLTDLFVNKDTRENRYYDFLKEKGRACSYWKYYLIIIAIMIAVLLFILFCAIR